MIMAGSITADWKSQLGKFASNLNGGWTLTFDDAGAENLDKVLPSLEAKLTFLKLAAGVRIRL